MEYGTMMKEARDNANMNFYQNPGYHFERQKNKTITINVTSDITRDVHLANVTNTFSLEEPLRVDKLSDIYIDSFVSNGGYLGYTSASDVKDKSPIYVLGIKEFNIQSVSNINKYHNKLIIPNTGTHAENTEEVGVPHAHRSTKFNYIGTVNPSTLSSLEISLSNSSKGSIIGTFIGSGDNPGPATLQFWITFIIVARD
jgi:hypothetical protein